MKIEVKCKITEQNTHLSICLLRFARLGDTKVDVLTSLDVSSMLYTLKCNIRHNF